MPQLIRVSLNPSWPDEKPRKGEHGRLIHGSRPVDLSKGWINVRLSYPQVFHKITQERAAVCARLACPKGSTEPRTGARNFISHSLALVDIDHGMTIPELRAHPLYAEYGAGYYASPSHSEERHKFRVIFRLEEDITSPQNMRNLYRGLIKTFNSDKACQDASRFFFGNKTDIAECRENTLPVAEVQRLIELGQANDPVENERLYSQEPQAPLSDALKAFYVEKLRSTFLGNESTWYRVGLAMRDAGFTQGDFIRATVDGMMNQKDADHSREKWQKIAKDKHTISFGYIVNLLNQHDTPMDGMPQIGEFVTICGADIITKPIRWLWKNRIARGKVTLISGNPGLGKSQLTLSLGAIISRGGTWPVDDVTCDLGSVLLLSAEDDREDTIIPRFVAASGNVHNIHILKSISIPQNDGGTKNRGFDLTQDLERMALRISQIGNVHLLVIDPLSAYLGSNTDSHNNASVRGVMGPLAELASRTGVAVVAVDHLNKNAKQEEALLRFMGSIGFVGAARTAYVVLKDDHNDARRLFLPVKNNLGLDTGGLAFRLESVLLAGEIETSCVAWEADAVTITADDAMNPSPDDDSKKDAKGFLLGFLSQGPRLVHEIKEAGKAHGFSESTLQRARNLLGARRYNVGNNYYWELLPKPEDIL